MEIVGNLNQPWNIKYSPKSIDEMILPKTTRRFFHHWINGNRTPLVLHGNPGTGKSILARLLSDDQPVLVECSRGVEIDRIKAILNSASSIPLHLGRRTIIFDDVEGLSPVARTSLRVIERLTTITDFIFTTNNIQWLDSPLKSRLMEIDFNFRLDSEILSETKDRLKSICSKEMIDPPDNRTLEFLIKSHYPDLRKTISELQKTILLR